MSKIKVSIQGAAPLLMSRFTEANAAQVSSGTSTTIRIGSKGTPREQAEPKLYLTPDGKPMLPGPNIFRGLIDAGQFHKSGRRAITTSRASLVPAGLQLEEIECPIENPFGDKVTWEVDSRSVVNPATGGRMMAHRPRFDAWKVSFTLIVDDKMFDVSLVRALVDDLGSKIGLGDFRPARKGPFGRFNVTLWQQIVDKVKKETKAA